MLLYVSRLITDRPCGNILQDNIIESIPRRLFPTIALLMLDRVYSLKQMDL